MKRGQTVKNKIRGFTIVELIIVIIVIAILATLVITAYNGVQDKAKLSKAQADLSQLEKAILVARVNTGETLKEITGSGYTWGPCVSGTDVFLPPPANCWNRYRLTLSDIAAAAGTSLSGLNDGSPYGLPYRIDENEGDNPDNPCANKDSISAVAYQTPLHILTVMSVPFSLPQCN